jgi:hypothetical protein
VNRDSHNIHRAYQKSRLLREENNEENFPDSCPSCGKPMKMVTRDYTFETFKGPVTVSDLRFKECESCKDAVFPAEAANRIDDAVRNAKSTPGEDNEEDGTEDTGLSELEAWEKKLRLPREYQDEQYSGQPTLEFYFNKRMDELVDEFEKKLGKEWYRGNLQGQTPDEYHYNKGFEDSIIYDLIEKYTDKTSDGQYKIYNVNKRTWIRGYDDVYDYLYNQYIRRNEQENTSKDDDDYDDEGSNGSHDDDPTGQDEPIDYRSQSEKRSSDRLDYARRKVEKGEWDEERADEYRRGA